MSFLRETDQHPFATIPPPALPTFDLYAAIDAALQEDAGDFGDITTLSTVPESTTASATFLAKAEGVLAGVYVAQMVFRRVDPAVQVTWQEFIMDPHLMPAFVEQLTAAAPLLEQICITAGAAADSRNADLLNSAVATYIKVISDACLASGMKMKGVRTDKDRWLRKVTRIPPSVATREQRKAFKREHKKGVRRCDVAGLHNQHDRPRKQIDRSRKARRALGARKLERLLKEDPRGFHKHYRKPPSPMLVPPEKVDVHFKDVLGGEPPDLPIPPIMPGTVPSAESIEGLQQTPFSMEELVVALKKIKNRASMLCICVNCA